MTLSIGLFVFNNMEILDYAAPYQVFATASRVNAQQQSSPSSTTAPTKDGEDLFSLVTISSSTEPVTMQAGAVILPQATIGDHPELSCLVIPGGKQGVEALINQGDAVTWIKEQAATVPLVASVCTGAFLLAHTGLLDGRKATTHWAYADDLRQRFPAVDVVDSHRWTDSGQFITAAGLTSGIDMALHLVERMSSRELSVATARALEM
ncbi:MAG: DJ-1/PfpI family protein [Propionibacteriaceae bacterium]|nr:DJ-1/PfpI family protein [Propionibacteriaceae bacterium]